jgi:hypothetical protein
MGIFLSLSLAAPACTPPDGGEDPAMESDNADTPSVAQGTDDGWLYSDAISRFMGVLGPWSLNQYDEYTGDSKCQYNIRSHSDDYGPGEEGANLTIKGVDRYQLPDLSPFTTFDIEVQAPSDAGRDGFRPVMCLNAKPDETFLQCGVVKTQKAADGTTYYGEYNTAGTGAVSFRKAGWVVVTTEDSYKAGKVVPIANGNGRYQININAYRFASGDCPANP